MEDESTNALQLLSAKKNRSKMPNIREMRRFWKSANLQRLEPTQRLCLCKMVSLGHIFELPKTCEKRFYNHIRVVLWKKPLEKTPSIQGMRRCCSVQNNCTTKTKHSRNETISKISHLARAIAFERWSVLVKNGYQKHTENDSTMILELICGERTLEKNTKYSREKN